MSTIVCASSIEFRLEANGARGQKHTLEVGRIARPRCERGPENGGASMGGRAHQPCMSAMPHGMLRTGVDSHWPWTKRRARRRSEFIMARAPAFETDLPLRLDQGTEPALHGSKCSSGRRGEGPSVHASSFRVTRRTCSKRAAHRPRSKISERARI